MIVSSKPDQLYNNSCGHRNGQPPKGFMPGSHAAAAEFFALYYKHCMPPTAQNRVFMEVSNECDVKTGPTACDSPWSEMIALHAAVGDAIRTMYNNITTTGQPQARPLVCGPTEAFPEYQLNDFRTWRDGGQLSEFLQGTVRNSSIDCLSTHIYSTYQFTPNATGRDSVTDPFSSHYVAREVNNVDAILDMQEAAITEASGASGDTYLRVWCGVQGQTALLPPSARLLDLACRKHQTNDIFRKAGSHSEGFAVHRR